MLMTRDYLCLCVYIFALCVYAYMYDMQICYLCLFKHFTCLAFVNKSSI